MFVSDNPNTKLDRNPTSTNVVEYLVMTTNVPSIDDAADQLHLGYSVFIGVCVAASLFFIPSFLGGHALPPGGQLDSCRLSWRLFSEPPHHITLSTILSRMSLSVENRLEQRHLA